MKSTSGKATTASAHGQKFKKPIEFGFTWDIFENDEEFQAEPKNFLSVKEQREYRDEQAKTKARTAAQAEVWEKAGVKKPTLDDAQFRLRSVVAALEKNGVPSAQAREQASTLLGIEWQDYGVIDTESNGD